MIKSIKSGNWSDSAVWSGVITASETLQIDHNILFDVPQVTVAGVTISQAARLTFRPDITATLQSSKNVVVNGQLIIAPLLSTLVHTLRFINVDESKFVGEGDAVVDSDVGLWVMGSGTLVALGNSKKGWTNSTGTITAGSNNIQVFDDFGWMVGDEIVIVPTDKGASNYDERTISGLNNSSVILSSQTTSHPVINGKWTAEVANLTRNVRIEGTQNGQSHIFIKSAVPSHISYVQFRYLGPRKSTSPRAVVVGRYGLHFHHCEDATRGMTIIGCVARDCNNHSFVSHASHGMQWVDNVAYNVTETPYWYDMGHSTHDMLWQSNLAALIKYVPGALQPEDGTPAFGTSGFLHGMGDGNSCIGCVAVGVQGKPRIDYNGGFEWRANNEGRWIHRNNLAHHCSCDGIRTWQNSTMIHVVENYSSYYNITAIFHGAYTNNYRYTGGVHYGNPIIIHAGSDGDTPARVIFDNHIVINGGQGNGDTASVNAGVIIEGSPVKSLLPLLLRNNTFANCLTDVYDANGEQTHNVDIVGGNSTKFVAKGAEVIRFQPTTGPSLRITSSGTTTIAPFAPSIWGEGMGLRGDYYNDPNFKNLVMTRIDPFIDFQEWSLGIVHYAITSKQNSVEWAGQIQPQFTETYTFSISCDAGGSGDLIVDGLKVASGQKGQGSIFLTAGKLYSIEIDFTSTGPVQAGINMRWTSPSFEKYSSGGEYVNQSQLFADLPPSTTTTSTTTKSPSTTTTSTTTRGTSTTKTTSTTTTTTTTKMATTSTTTTSTTTKPGPKVIIELLDDNTWRAK